MSQKKQEIGRNESATQRDLELWGGQLQHQMQGLEKRIDDFENSLGKKIEVKIGESEDRMTQLIDHWGEKIMEHIDVAVENRQVDVGIASVEQVEALAEKVDDHEVRLKVVEERG